MAEYIRVCPVTDIAEGERAVFQIRRQWVVIFNVQNIYYAIEDMCTHDEGVLSEDDSGNPVPLKQDYIIACSRHGARFDIRDGRALTPAITAVNVPSYAVRIVEDHIEISI